MQNHKMGEPRHILFVEDSDHDAFAFSRSFKKSFPHCEVTHCKNALDAIKCLSENTTMFDMLITDYKLPGMSGIEMYQEILSINADLPTIILTGMGCEDVAVQALKLGAYDYIVKDKDGGYLNLLPAVINNAIQKHADLTARKLAEEALVRANDELEQHVEERTNQLKNSELQYRILVETSPHGIQEIDTFGNILFCNQAYGKMIGYTPKELIKRNASIFLPKEDRKKFVSDLSRLATQQPVPQPYFYQNITKDGQIIEVEVNWNYKRNAEGDVVGFISLITDISERKKAEVRIKELARFPEENPSPVMRFNCDGILLHANKASSLFLESINCAVGKQVPEEWQRLLDDAFKNKTTMEIERQYAGHTFSFQLVPVVADNYINIYGRDITKLRNIEENLRKLLQTVEQSPNLLFITDNEGTIEYANDTFYNVTGFAPEQVIGQTPRIIQSGNTSKATYENLWATIRAGKVWRGEIQDRCKDGQIFWADATIAPIRDEDGTVTHFSSTHIDITIRKEAELEMHDAKNHAQVANRAKTDLMANMSHELRTPLNAIIGFSSTIKEEVFGPIGNDKYLEYIDDIQYSGQHLLELINDILDVSAIEAGAVKLHEENINISDVIDASIRIIRPRADDGKVIVLSSISSVAPHIFADERRIKQVFLNLLSNAVKFTPEGGEISVNSWLNENASLSISVADTGTGMDEDEVEKALSKFGQVDSGLNRKHDGTGLGLPLTVGLMECHGGALEVKSEKGKGTQIIVTFPKERVV